MSVKLAPETLVGRKLRVYWPDDDGWYLGTVVQYSAQTGQHKVSLQLLMSHCFAFAYTAA